MTQHESTLHERSLPQFPQSPKIIDRVTQHESTLYERSSPQSPQSPKIIELKRQVRMKHARMTRLEKKLLLLSKKGKKDAKKEEIVKSASKYLPQVPLNFFASQLAMADRKRKGFWWTSDVKLLALSIFYHGKRAFRFLSKIFKLPTIRLLQQWMQCFLVRPGFCIPVLNVLKQKMEAMEDKLCVLVFDEMSLKTNLKYDANIDKIVGTEDFGSLGRSQYVANHALVFMVKGLRNRWKQAFGYFLVCDSAKVDALHSLMFEALKKLSDIGCIVKAVVCDQGATNRALFTKLDITFTKPYFFLDNHQILCFYDPPHLIKSVRNNFMKYDFVTDEGHVSFKHVKTFYEKDSKLPLRMCPKIRPKHIELTNFSKMRVCLATQLLSHSTAAALMTYISINELPPEANATAAFIERMDQLFDTLNSTTRFCKIKPHRNAMSRDTLHMAFLQETQGWLCRLRVINNGKSIYCIDGWILVISAVVMLWTDVLVNNNYQHLMTCRINQDCLENFFASIRQANGCADNPVPSQFNAAMKQCMVNSLMRPSKLSNCAFDGDAVLTTINELTRNVTGRLNENTNESASAVLHTRPCKQNIVNTVTDSCLSSLPYMNTVHYIAGYLLTK